MIDNLPLAWALSLAFTGTAIWCSWRVLTDSSPGARAHNAVHAVMSVVMLTMPWRWGMDVPTAPQIVFFGLASCGYVLWALRVRRTAGPSAHHANPVVLGYHAVMMAAMVWMAVLMRGDAASGAVGGTHDAMAGMQMSGMSVGGLQHGVDLGVGTVAASLAAGGFFLVAAGLWLRRSFALVESPGPRTRRLGTISWDHYAATLMATGMALMFVVPVL